MNKEIQKQNTQGNAEEWKLKEVLGLVAQYSKVYLIKFIALEGLAFLSTILLPIDHYGLLVTSLTFVASLLFDQITKNKLDEKFDYKKIGNLCNMGIVFVSGIFIVVLILLIAVKQIEENVPLIVCKVIMFIISFVAAFSALIEGIANLPPQTLPSQQEKIFNTRRERFK